MALPLAPIAGFALRYGAVALTAYAIARVAERGQRDQRAEDAMDDLPEGVRVHREPTRWAARALRAHRPVGGIGPGGRDRRDGHHPHPVPARLMQLIDSPASPFCRKVKVVLHETGLAGTWRLVRRSTRRSPPTGRRREQSAGQDPLAHPRGRTRALRQPGDLPVSRREGRRGPLSRGADLGDADARGDGRRDHGCRRAHGLRGALREENHRNAHGSRHNGPRSCARSTRSRRAG
jgi:hypothetical protein